jgi:adenine-specific DNA-methyltransferase
VTRRDRHGSPELDQWFTPFWAAEELVNDALRGLGVVNVAEPSCGNGAFLAAIPASCGAFGVEIDPAMIPLAQANSGREVLLGDFRTVDLAGRPVEAVVGNPPFKMELVDGFLDRAHALLPEGGLVALILPAFAFMTPSRVNRWSERFALDVNMIPRTLFRGIRNPLVWAKYRKAGRRYVRGLMMFSEQGDFEAMRPNIREALERPGTWRAAVSIALQAHGGTATVREVYEEISPNRRAGAHWQPKVRQTLQRHCVSLGQGRWALAA